jgi:hypothetical protein
LPLRYKNRRPYFAKGTEVTEGNSYYETHTRDKILRRKFGIGVKEYNDLFVLQNGCCAICRKHQSEFRWRLAVDHNHATKAIRGLLCLNCNSAIGKLQDDPELIRAAARYVEERP